MPHQQHTHPSSTPYACSTTHTHHTPNNTLVLVHAYPCTHTCIPLHLYHRYTHTCTTDTHTHNYNTIHSTVTLYTLAALTHPTLLATHACPINNRQPLISNTRTPHQHHIHTTLPVCLISTTHTHHQHYTHEAPHTHTPHS